MSTGHLLPNLTFRPTDGDKSVDILPTSGMSMLVTDHVDAPAAFLLIRAASAVLKRTKTSAELTSIKRCIFLSFTQDIEHWKALLSKTGLNPAKAVEDGNLSLLDLLSWWRNDIRDGVKDKGGFDRFFDHVYTSLQQELNRAEPSETIVLIDDLAHLEWIGLDEQHILRFLRSVRSLLRKNKCSLLATYHNLAMEAPASSVHRYLVETCTVHVECRPLGSGRSGAVSGEVCVPLFT
ncbi:hypothetical protein CPB86DRAFT_780613 [Serendipita vermifera]|nr:hypothetical protein CPB86DRAFT_780613 [Serendipita vermifera]